MVVPIIIGLVVLVIVAVGVVRLVRFLRTASLVSPILLEQALDADLRGLCRQLRQQGDLSAADRRRYSHLIVSIAARRTAGDESDEDRERVRQACRDLRRRA